MVCSDKTRDDLSNNNHCFPFIIFDPTKGGFYSESAIRFLDLQISKTKYSEKLSWAWNLNLLFTVFGGKFKFQAQDSFSEYFFWRFGDLENESHFLKKSHLYSKRFCARLITEFIEWNSFFGLAKKNFGLAQYVNQF